MKNVIHLIFLVLATTLTYAQDAPLTMTDDLAEAEFHTVINPTDPNNIVVATMHGFETIGDSYFSIYYSTDFGVSWDLSEFQGKYPSDEGTGDPVMSFDNAGNLYLCHLIARDNEISGVFTVLSRSTDKGKTWEEVYEFEDPFTDKPWLAIDQNPSSPHFGNIYIIDVTSLGVSLISIDSELNFIDIVSVPDVDHLPSVIVAQNGDVFTSGMKWISDPVEFYVHRYTNGGKDLVSSVPLAQTPDYTFDVSDVSNRFQFSPYLAIDNTNSDYAGRLYFTFTSSEQDGERFFDVLQLYSDDEGLTWSPAKQVHSNLDFHVQQYYPSSYVNPEGVVLVDWYDRKNYGEGSNLTDFFIGISYNGGEDYTEYKLNTQSMDFTQMVTAGNSFGIGEYHQLVATEETAISFWSDGRMNDGDLNIYYAKIDIDDPISGVFESGLIQKDISISNIYPLPASDIIHVDLDLEKGYTIDYEILDLTGKTILKGPKVDYSKGKHTMELKNVLAPGNYILKINTDTAYFKSMQFVKS